MTKPRLVLGIESSCDETAVAIVGEDRRILAHQVLSQREHVPYGGVVPEVAARAHLQHMDHLVEDSLREANVTLDDLSTMVKEGADFIVYDAKSGEDLTRTILTQIIFEEESQGEHLLPINFLRQLIGFYDNSLKGFVPHYLESTMQTFTKNQEKMQEMLGLGTLGSFGQVAAQLEEIGKQNMEMFTKAAQAMTHMTPPNFAAAKEDEKAPTNPKAKSQWKIRVGKSNTKVVELSVFISNSCDNSFLHFKNIYASGISPIQSQQAKNWAYAANIPLIKLWAIMAH